MLYKGNLFALIIYYIMDIKKVPEMVKYLGKRTQPKGLDKEARVGKILDNQKVGLGRQKEHRKSWNHSRDDAQ